MVCNCNRVGCGQSLCITNVVGSMEVDDEAADMKTIWGHDWVAVDTMTY